MTRLSDALAAYRIENSAESDDERSFIMKEHKTFIYRVAALGSMEALAKLWRKAFKLQEQTRAIAGKALKSNDILYPCRFCKRLWR